MRALLLVTSVWAATCAAPTATPSTPVPDDPWCAPHVWGTFIGLLFAAVALTWAAAFLIWLLFGPYAPLTKKVAETLQRYWQHRRRAPPVARTNPSPPPPTTTY